MVGKLFSQENVKQTATQNANLPVKETENRDVESLLISGVDKFSKWWHFLCLPVFVVLIVFFLTILLPMLDQVDLRTQYLLNKQVSTIQDKCSFEIVESIPEGLVYPDSAPKHTSTYDTWKNLIQIAQHSIEIGSFYWTLRGVKEFPVESKKGDDIYNDLLNAGLKRNISIRIAQSKPTKKFPAFDTVYLMTQKAAQVKFLDFDAIVGSGVLHTKFWIVDRRHLYLGSANLDWRALNQVKELGVSFYNCSAVADDLGKVFDVYWMSGNVTKLPSEWPTNVSTVYNSKNPFDLELNAGEKTKFYISNSPPKMTPKGRNDDLAALLKIIKDAKEFVHISVMDYLPLVLFSQQMRFWPAIDNELRKAVVERNVQVRLLISRWKNTKPMTVNFLRSLASVNKFRKNAVVEVKWFEVPSTRNQSKIPFARVNHNKYMVTDRGAFVGTSNWSGDYFLSTAGVSLVSPVVNGSSNFIQQQVKAVFERDWNSTYAKFLTSQ